MTQEMVTEALKTPRRPGNTNHPVMGQGAENPAVAISLERTGNPNETIEWSSVSGSRDWGLGRVLSMREMTVELPGLLHLAIMASHTTQTADEGTITMFNQWKPTSAVPAPASRRILSLPLP